MATFLVALHQHSFRMLEDADKAWKIIEQIEHVDSVEPLLRPMAALVEYGAEVDDLYGDIEEALISGAVFVVAEVSDDVDGRPCVRGGHDPRSLLPKRMRS